MTPRAFGEGSIHPFEYYFRDRTLEHTASLEELGQWLRECTYETDLAQFGRPDVWQTPAEFERRRRGDCDDHALWAWRRLIELGYEAHLFSGLVNRQEAEQEHLWVVMRDLDGEEYLVESIAKRKDKMFVPLAEAKERYRPFCSVDASFHCVCYGGLLVHLRRKYLA